MINCIIAEWLRLANKKLPKAVLNFQGKKELIKIDHFSKLQFGSQKSNKGAEMNVSIIYRA